MKSNLLLLAVVTLLTASCGNTQKQNDMQTNETLEVLKTRRSIRAYRDEMPDKSLIDRITEAGTYAPTGKGRQSPIIVAVTTVAVNAGAMDQGTASVLVAAGGITVFIMPLLASVTARSVNAHLGEALREIREQPRAVAHILAEHRRRERELHRQLKARLREAGLKHSDVFDLTERCPGSVCPAPEAKDDGR